MNIKTNATGTVTIAAFVGGILTLLSILVGAWIVFKSKSTNPNEPFIGKSPRGEMFTVDTGDVPLFPEVEEPSKEEKHILKKTEKFLSNLAGGKE